VKGIFAEGFKNGCQPIYGDKEEEWFAKGLNYCAEWGFPLIIKDFRDVVHSY